MAAILLAATSASGATVVPGKAQLTWAPASGPVAGYTVQVSRNGSPWTQVQTVSQTSLSVVFPAGTNARIRVAAFDANGNTGPWSTPSVVLQFVTPTGGSTASGGSATPPGNARFDLNGDGFDDLLWQNTANGSYHAWFMVGSRRVGQATVRRPADAAAQIAGVADFDNDGRNDLLYFDSLTGAMWIATKGGVSGKLVAIPSAPRGWDVAAVGHFDGYGGADILLRNLSTGADKLWLFNANLSVEKRALPQVDPQWAIAAAMDYNGDGTTDIFWRNTVSGADVVWQFANGSVAQWFPADPVGPPWEIAAVGDFNGDGKDDLLWRAASAGSDVGWIWFGAKNTPFRVQRPTFPVDGSWQVAAVVHFDSTPSADLLWNRTATGQDVAFLMNGASVSRSLILPTAPANWAPVPSLSLP